MPKTLSPATRTEVQRILDAAARRMLAEGLDDPVNESDGTVGTAPSLETSPGLDPRHGRVY